jgi:hypothetical protein
VGIRLIVWVGLIDGACDGKSNGRPLGCIDGSTVGLPLSSAGLIDGTCDGKSNGRPLGFIDGSIVGLPLSSVDGEILA